ncbi:Methyltransferase type 12 [Leadbetterella byssophila DSM 17132]|uniref:Methyltransferase type 12 n=1 Tax=Leadbetterella byssophila (strain DSM 17132 / JCM 16389 / KACC 11308 / NBRC 106382 / 4M15) TaxID=649349 RepID=E4RWT3_LEAB4|nr:class I SAM-dependent methyltransferase [Leadbetterella byssophila]ADQ16252.1 Methyltransferase type 12 [Leadbetterella byssophila DSM 17132]
MFINYQEYQAMYEVEDSLWWYRILHDRVVEELKALPHFTQLKILDAGCGTGGLMSRLLKEGVQDIQGFDFNEHAVAFSGDRGLNVQQGDITRFSLGQFDVVISNDVLYQMDDEGLEQAFYRLYAALKPGGILITNNQAFPVFRGIHDLAVGSKRRFVLKDFEKLLEKYPDLKLEKATYWSLFLSPFILIARTIQRIQLKLNLVKEVKSDVSLPSPWLNQFFYTLCTWERKILKASPFGSSLFLRIRKA